jgi:hypothetical protein
VADITISVEIGGGVSLPYVAAAETALAAADLAAFDAISAIAGIALTLTPAFDLPVAELADLLAAARKSGHEPPDLFAWFSVTVPDAVAAAVIAALQALPFVVQAAPRLQASRPGLLAATDPDAIFEGYLQRYPVGHDAMAAWQVPGGSGAGVRVADVEESWDLAHPDLAPAAVVALAPITSTHDRDHGTGALGIVGARANDVGLTGLAPASALAVSPDAGGHAIPAAVLRAAHHVGRGGIVLIEEQVSLGGDAMVPVEHDVLNRIAIQAATALGVLVVEPAGNGGVDLDHDPRCPELRAFAPPGIDSGALVVAAAQRELDATGERTGRWMADEFTSGGLRVNCFAAGEGVAAPQSNAAGLTGEFSGTSAASAIVAGVAAAFQGAATASDSGTLSNTELRARLADPQYGHWPGVSSPLNPRGIGVMPDLELLLEGIGVPRLPPATAIRHEPGAVLLARLRRGSVDQLELLEWREATAAWQWSLTTGADAPIANGHPVALHVHASGVMPVVDAVTPSRHGAVLHRPLVLDAGLGLGEPWRTVTQTEGELTSLRISAPVTAVAAEGRLLVSGLAANGDSLVVVLERKADGRDIHPQTPAAGFPGPHEPVFVRIAPGLRFHCPPVLHDAAGSVVLAGVDRTGTVSVARWTLGTGWSGFVPVATDFDPAEPPAVVHDGPALHVLGVDPATGLLREVVQSPDADHLMEWTAARTIALPPLVTWGPSLAIAGAIAAAADGAGTLMVVGLTAEGRPVFSVRPAGLDWTPLFFIPALTTFVARAGVAVASPAAGIFVAWATDARGALHAARWTILGWTPFAAV